MREKYLMQYPCLVEPFAPQHADAYTLFCDECETVVNPTPIQDQKLALELCRNINTMQRQLGKGHTCSVVPLVKSQGDYVAVHEKDRAFIVWWRDPLKRDCKLVLHANDMAQHFTKVAT